MSGLCRWAVVVLAAAPAARAAAPSSAERPDPQVLADRIDKRIAEAWKGLDVQPAPAAGDAEFLRRVSLDLTGRIPTVAEVRSFLADRAGDKRRLVIGDLLDSRRHELHFVDIWRSLLLPEAAANREARFLEAGLETWLRDRLAERTPYDRMVRELLTVPLPTTGEQPLAVIIRPEQSNPLAFIAGKEAKAENVAAAATRLFLGIRLECAQCHNHPFSRWTRDQFWNQAAFFSGIVKKGDGLFAPLLEDIGNRRATVPNGGPTVDAVFLDGGKPAFRPGASPRAALADWVTSRENPFFAKAAVNREWGRLMGVGLVEPVDDFNDANTPSHPELLDDLAAAFVASGFDLRYITEAICLSRSYQRTSALSHPSQEDPRRYARAAVKGLTAEQFFDSLSLAVGHRERTRGEGFERGGRPGARAQFLAQFAAQGTLTEPETSIQQALALMNGQFVGDAVAGTAGTMAAVRGTPGLDTAGRIEILYMSALSRPPTPREAKRLLQFVRDAGPDKEPDRLGDVFWMVLNTAEFRLNH